ncbi:hypothetical protein JMJ76_0002657, partial [Colletotrichum scovillei]
SAGRCLALLPLLLPLLPRSFLLLGWLAPALLLLWLADGWLPPSFEPDLPGQSCLATSSNQTGMGGVQGTAWGCTSEWPEVGGVSGVKLTLKHNHDTEQSKVRTSRHGNGRIWTIRWCTRETGTARESEWTGQTLSPLPVTSWHQLRRGDCSKVEGMACTLHPRGNNDSS